MKPKHKDNRTIFEKKIDEIVEESGGIDYFLPTNKTHTIKIDKLLFEKIKCIGVSKENIPEWIEKRINSQVEIINYLLASKISSNSIKHYIGLNVDVGNKCVRLRGNDDISWITLSFDQIDQLYRTIHNK